MKHNNNIPKLRFPEFSGEWEEKKMKELFIINAGGDINKNNVSPIKTDKYKYPIYANAEKDKGLYGFSDIYKVEGKTLTIAGRGINIGITHARNEKFYPIVRLLVLKPKKEEEVKFYEYQFNRQNIFVESTGVPQLTAPQISTYTIFKPQLPEQQKIASFLTAVDSKIELLQKKKQGLERYKKGIMQKIFSQELRFKDENGNDYPDWEEKKLGEIATFLRGSALSKSDLIDDGNFSCIHYGELFTKYNEVINKTLSKTNIECIVKSLKGDILMPSSDVTPDGLAKASSIQLDGVILGGDINIVRPTKVHSIFLSYLLNFSKNKIIRIVTGTTVKHIYNKDIKILEFTIPKSKEEQIQIANFLSAIDTKIDLVNTQLKNTQQFKKGLLQQMFV